MFRFKCNTCGAQGPKRKKRNWATRDKNQHLRELGKEGHDAIVVAAQ